MFSPFAVLFSWVVFDAHFQGGASPLMGHQLRLGLRALGECMPQHAIAMRRLARQSSSFRELVLDFSDALQALERYEQRGKPQEEPRVAEYRDLISELTTEVRNMVHKAKSDRT